MKLYYKIISHNLAERNIVVRYYTDVITEKELSVIPNESNNNPVRCRSDISLNVPIPEPTLIGLHKLILRNAPRQALKDLENIKLGTEVTGIDLSLKNTETLLDKLFAKTEEEMDLLLSLSKPSGNNASILTPQQTSKFLQAVNEPGANT